MRIFAVVFTMAISTAPVLAGWQWMEWGMKAEEVEAVSPSAVEAIRPEDDVVYLGTHHAAVGHQFDVEMGIDGNGLRSVLLTSTEAAASSAIKAGLHEKYGESR